MSEFDNWKEEQDRIHNDYDAENAWYAGQQSQQAKIDLLEKELTETQAFLNKQNHIKQAKIYELQGRIDELQAHSLMLREAANSWTYSEGEKNILLSQADDLDRILKGNKDEN